MVGTVLDGKALSESIKAKLKLDIEEFVNKKGIRPGLAVVLVGSRKDSATYVSMKKKGCLAVGIESFSLKLPEDVSETVLLEEITKLNQNPLVHGILVQLPLPSHLNEQIVLQSVHPSKDVDGLHPVNMGHLLLGNPGIRPCTPMGCIELIKSTGTVLEGKIAVVLGRSNIVGKPMAQLLALEQCTVVLCHSRTENIQYWVGQADILVAAVGKPGLVKGDWVKPGAIVVDVGINAVADSSTKRGYRLVGDVEYEVAKEKADFITPVPGGVGPMTIAMLLCNTFYSAIGSIE